MNESTLKKLPDSALLDFGVDHSGTGYRLEKMGDIVLVRPLPSTTARQQNPELWKKAHGIFKESRRGHGDWTFSAPLPDHGRLRFRFPVDCFSFTYGLHRQDK